MSPTVTSISSRGGSKDSNRDVASMPLLGWTKAEVEEFQNIWKSMIESNDAKLKGVGLTIVMWLLEFLPETKNMFRSFDATGNLLELVNDQKFVNHALNLVYKLDALIGLLGEPEVCHQEMRAISRTHIGRKIKAAHFESFRDKFHNLVYDVLRSGRKSRPSVMWYQFLNAFVTIYTAEEKDYRSEQKRKRLRKVFCCFAAAADEKGRNDE